MTCFLQVAPVATFFFLLDLPLQFFFKLCLSMDFLPARTSPSLTSFSGCARRCFFFTDRARRWLLFQVAHIADFFQGRASRWFCPRLRMSLIFFRVARVRRWLPSQVAHIADFFSCVAPVDAFLQVTHVVDFLFLVARLRRWLLFHRSRLLLIFPHLTTVAVLFFLVTRFPRWLLLQIVSVMDCFFTSRTSRNLFFSCWSRRCFFFKLCLSMDFLPVRTSPYLISFSACARRWLFLQVAPVADFFFRLRTSLTISQVAPVADFSPGYACRWLFFRVARVPRWLPS